MNFPVRGFNECLIMYVLAASGENYPVPTSVYHKGWAQSNFFKNGKTFYGHLLPLGFDYGGPLFFSQYSFLGLNPTNIALYEIALSHRSIKESKCFVENI